MKVLVGAKSMPIHWFPKGEFQHLLMATTFEVLSFKSVIGLSSDQWSEIKKSSENKYLLETLTRKKVTVADVRQPEDCELSQDWNLNLPQLVNSPKFEEFYEKHTKVQSPKEPNQAVFDRAFSHLLPHALSFEYVDSHFYQKLESKDSGAYFLIDNLIKSGVPRIVIYTQKGTKRTNQYRDFVIRELEKYSKSLSTDQTIRIELFNEGPQFPHDRLGAIQFKNRCLHFYLGYGEQMFSSNSGM